MPKKVKLWQCLQLVYAIASLMSLNSCALLLETKVNKKFPKVSPEARKVQNVVASSFAISQIDTACVGVNLPSVMLIEALTKEIKAQRTSSIPDADSVVLDTSTVNVSFSNQEIQVESDATVYISANSPLKLLKSFKFHIKGFVSPYFVDAEQSLNTTLHLNPNVEELKISKIKFRNFFLNALNPIVQYIVDDFSKRFIENINGLMPDLQAKLNMSLLLQTKYSELISSAPEIQVVNDASIVINKKLGNKAVLIQPSGLKMISDIKDVPPTTIKARPVTGIAKTEMVRNVISKHANSQAKWTTSTSEKDISRSDFNSLFAQYSTDFYKTWDLSLDSMELVDNNHINTQVSQKFIVSFSNQLLNQPNFSFRLTPVSLPPIHIDKTRLELMEKPTWDCNQIAFHCDLNDCNNVFHNCGSCKWYDVPCHIGWTACQIANGVAYAGCQSLNAVKLGACTVSFVAQKAYCFAKYAVLYATHDLITIGDIEGDFNLSVSGQGTLGMFSFSNDLSTFNLNTSQIIGRGTVSGNINYSKDWETALTSVLQCNCLGVYLPIPIGCNFPISPITGDFAFPESISGNIQKAQDAANNRARAIITSNSIPIQIQFKDQTPFEALFSNAGLTIRCQALFFGTALWGIAGNFFKFNDNLQQKYDAIFKGTYTYQLSPKTFSFDLSPITLDVPHLSHPVVLNSSWTNKSITYKE